MLVLVPLIYFFVPVWRHKALMFWLIFLASLAAIFSVEAGWIVTEVGRQPFVVAGLMTTATAFTPSANVVAIALIFPVLYLGLAIAAFWIPPLRLPIAAMIFLLFNSHAPFIAVLLAAFFLWCYIVLASAEFGSSLFWLFPALAPDAPLAKLLSPVWEANNVFLVGFYRLTHRFFSGLHSLARRRALPAQSPYS